MTISYLDKEGKKLAKETKEAKKLPKVILSPEFWEEVDYQMTKTKEITSSDKEWLAHLLYTTNEADNFEDLVIKAEHIWPSAIGEPAHVKIEEDEAIEEMYNEFTEGFGIALDLPYYLGTCHSHHNMRVFFSEEDMQDLRNKYDTVSPFYLSLIFGYGNRVVGKISFPEKKIFTNTEHYYSYNGKKYPINSEKTTETKIVMKTIDVEIISERKEHNVPEFLVKLADKLEADYNKPKPTYIQSWGTDYEPPYNKKFTETKQGYYTPKKGVHFFKKSTEQISRCPYCLNPLKKTELVCKSCGAQSDFDVTLTDAEVLIIKAIFPQRESYTNYMLKLLNFRDLQELEYFLVKEQYTFMQNTDDILKLRGVEMFFYDKMIKILDIKNPNLKIDNDIILHWLLQLTTINKVIYEQSVEFFEDLLEEALAELTE